ncbi:MAG TPA: xanthine dehydrogenase family protein subunit M [Burkholderiales bacterium]|jgi:carbon-monoxide dehydrogenase medium subunit|nr:xanthine dehydrogenase family protein subunit M [Burkholderiales bacterium]
MKPASFVYHAPQSLDALLALLAEHGEDAKILAGGQSLVPVMNFRLARPAKLFDLNGVAELDFLNVEQHSLRIGALTRHAAFHKIVAPGPTGTLLKETARHIAHYPIRQRGTFAGSIAHADPASEWCLIARTLEADIVARSRKGERVLKAADFFQGTFATALRPDEVITEVRLPVLDSSWRTGFYEFSRRAGDFALAMTAVALRIQSKKIVEARIGIGGVHDKPFRCAEAETALVAGKSLDEAAQAVSAMVKPMEDIHADAAYRKDLVRATTRRALEQAMDTP